MTRSRWPPVRSRSARSEWRNGEGAARAHPAREIAATRPFASRSHDIAQVLVDRWQWRSQQTKERAAHQRLVAGIRGHDVQREAFEDLPIGTAAQPLHSVAFLGDAIGMANDPFECAELHRSERIFERGDWLWSHQAAADSRPKAISRRSGGRERLAFELTGARIARRSVVMESMQIGIEDRSGDIAEKIVLIVLEHGLQRIALEKNASLELAEAVAGGAGRMADSGTGLIEHALAGKPRSPAEIDVLEIGEVVVVESTQRQERLATGDHVAAAGKEELIAPLRLAARSQRIAEAVLKSMAVEGHHAADEVDQLPAHVHDLSTDGDHIARCVFDGLNQSSQPAGLRNGIVVQEDDIPRRRSGQSCGDAASKAVILPQGKQTCFRESSSDGADASVSRTVVHNGDRRPIDITGLCKHGIEAGDRVVPAVPVDDDDIDRGQEAAPMRRV